MSKQAWSEAVKTNNLEEHMLLDPLYSYTIVSGIRSKNVGGVQVNVGGVQNMLGGCTNEVGGVRTPPENPPVIKHAAEELITFKNKQITFWSDSLSALQALSNKTHNNKSKIHH